ncbi:MAG TPA: hypothetical protein VMV69_14690 [Pirellulales bacterium]|nr:hypothetical protein [Pirellulales bacterium]
MIRSLLWAIVLGFPGLAGQVAAQPSSRRAAPPAAPGAAAKSKSEVVGPGPELLPRRGPFQATLEGGELPSRGRLDAGEQSLETITVPPQPPEPPPPRWGALDAAAPVVEFPLREYDVVGPARGVFQSYAGQVYRRRIRDPNTLLADDYRINAPINLQRPDGLAPAGVLGDHTLKSSQFLISWRYNMAAFDGDLSGTHTVSPATILGAFPYAPTRETVQQHVVLMEYSPTDDLTMMIRLPFQEFDIDYVNQAGGQIHTAKTDLGDIPITAMYALKRWNGQQIHLNFGLSIPTGLIDTLSDPFVLTSPNLSYWQRPSSTTWDLLPGLTYTGQSDRWSWGAQTIGTVRMGMGRYHYRLGDQVDMTTWVARRWTRGMSTSARLDGQVFTNGHGADPNIDPNLTPTNRINLMGGRRLDLLFGLNYYLPDRPRLPGSRLAIESGFPIYQSLDGPQLRASWLLNASWNILW